MEETFGGPSSILDSSGGLTNFLVRNGWNKVRYGYVWLNIKKGFWSSIFKQRVFEVVLEKDGVEISIIYNDKDGILGKEDVYKMTVNGSTSDWKPVDSFDKSKIKEFKRDSNIDSILKT